MSIDKSKEMQFFAPEVRMLPEDANKTLISPSDISLPESKDVNTYLSFFHHNLGNVAEHVGSKFEAADSFELLNNGFPPFFFTVFLLVVLTDDFLNEVSFDHFYTTQEQSDFEFSINVDAYQRSLDTIFSYLEGTISSSELFSRAEFLKDSSKVHFLDFCIKEFGNTLEKKLLMISKTDPVYVSWIASHPNQILNSSLSSYYPENLDCKLIYDLRLPVLNYLHILNCDTGFSRTFAPEYIETHRNFTSVDLGVKVVYALALNFGNLYGGFATSSLDQLKITQIFDGFINKLLGTFMGSNLDSIDYNKPRFSHILPKLERIRREQNREENLRQRQLKQEEKRKRKEEQRLKQAEAIKAANAKREEERKIREEQQAQQARIAAEEKRIRMIELAEYAAKKAIEEEALKREAELLKVNYILDRRSMIVSEFIDTLGQLKAAMSDTSGRSDAWQAELRDSLINLKAEFESFENFDEVVVPTDFVSTDDFGLDEFEEYNNAIKEDFNSLFVEA